MHDTVKVVDINPDGTYDSFSSWYATLEKFEKDYWVQIAKSVQKTDFSAELLAKKAMELYCLEMDINQIPNSQDYLEKLYKRLINNLIYASLVDQGLLKLVDGSISFLSEPNVIITPKGKNYLK